MCYMSCEYNKVQRSDRKNVVIRRTIGAIGTMMLLQETFCSYRENIGATGEMV